MKHLPVLHALALIAMLSTSAAAALPPLKVDAGDRFLVQDLGGGKTRPFFWQGDTAWNLHRLQKADIDLYLADRAAKGFNVIQGPVLDWTGLVTGPLKVANGYGKAAYTNKTTASPGLDADVAGAEFNDYFDQTDYIINKAESLGMYVMLLPFWAQGINDLDDNATEQAALREIGRKLSDRYKTRSSVIWCVGGEASGESPDASVRILAEGLEAGHGGAKLMGVHPTGNQSSGSRFHGESWLDFNMIQSGFGNPANYLLVGADYARMPAKPTFDSEPFYEDAGTPRGVAIDVRKGAYWSIFAGGFGVTYGHQAVWQMWLGGSDPHYGTSTIPQVDWKTALNAEGAADMIHLRRLMESRPFLTRIPQQSLILAGAGGSGNSAGDHVEATRDGTAGANDATYLMAYSPVAKSLTVDTSVIASTKLDAWWFDPRTGTATRFLSAATNTGSLAVTTPATGPDWVLVVDDAAKGYAAPGLAKPRLLVSTDIGGDPDDQQSMRRLMLYVNEFEIEGLVASASGTPGEVGSAIVRPDLIEEIVNDYATVRGNLALHAAGYPTADALRAVIKNGNPNRGMANVGTGKSTAGSNHIIARVDASAEKLHVTIWGGATDLAQALFDVNATRTAPDVAAFLAKLRVYAIADQDRVAPAQGPGEWIRANFPTLRYVEAGPPSMSSFTSLFRGMYQNDSTNPTIQLVADAVVPLNQSAWVTANLRTDHGALGAGYPLVTQNPGTTRNTSGVKEGDTPSWFYVLPNGLGDSEQPTWGGWGGRFVADTGGHFIDAQDGHFSGTSDAATRRKWTVARWRAPYQNDFAARMDWCVQPYTSANHNPIAAFNGDSTRAIVHLSAQAGATVNLSAAGSTDPDGNTLGYEWIYYKEAGTYGGALTITESTAQAASFIAPTVTSEQTIHVVLAVTDNGTPALTGYRRVIVTVAPSGGGGGGGGGTGPGAAHWKLDETSGATAADSSGNNNAATLTNSPVWTLGGKINGALNFNGTSHYAQAANSASLSLTKDFTIAAWIRPDVVNRIQGIVTKVTDSNDKQYALAISADGKLAFDYEKSGNNYALVAGALVTDQWQHVAVTVSTARVVTLYIGGAAVASNTAPAEVSVKTNPLSIGRWGGNYNTNYFDGLLDDVRIYNRTLDSAEIQTLHAGTAPQVGAGPDQTIALPAAATLAGTATDDGLPNGTVTAAWSKVSGPGGVSFANASQPATSATFAAPGGYVLRLSASDGVLAASDDVALTVNDSLAAWMTRNSVAATDDDDHDGATALEEYARGTDPHVHDTGAGPTAAITGDFLTLTYDRALLATDVTFTAKVSGNLLDWQPNTSPVGTPVNNGDGTETVTERDTVSIDQAASRFIRLEITAP